MKRILIIEDDLEVQTDLKEILELMDYQVVTADNGKSGVQLALNSSFDLILCDVVMPMIDGFGVLNILRKKPSTKNIPFVLLTEKSNNLDFRRGMNLGADDYLAKPFRRNDLLRVVEVRLEKSSNKKSTEEYSSFEFRNPELGYEELNQLFGELPAKEYRAKEVIFPEGKLLQNIYWVKKGRVKIAKLNDFEKEYIFSFIDPEKTFGYSAMFRNKPTGFSATAVVDSVVVAMDREVFLNHMKTKPDINFYFLKKLSENLHIKEAQIIHLAYNPIRKRVSDALFELSAQFSEGIISMSRDDLSHFVGMTKESLVRVLSEFKKENWVELKGNEIKIIDGASLLRFYGDVNQP